MRLARVSAHVLFTPPRKWGAIGPTPSLLVPDPDSAYGISVPVCAGRRSCYSFGSSIRYRENPPLKDKAMQKRKKSSDSNMNARGLG